MTLLRLKYVHEYRDRTGKVRRYFRRRGKKAPLPGDVGSEAFQAAYRAQLAEGTAPKAAHNEEGSFGRLVTDFYGSRAFADLKQSSRRTYRMVLDPLVRAYGDLDTQLSHRDAADLIAGIGANKPAMANLTKSVLQQLFKFAVKAGRRNDNPMIGIEHFKTGTHHTWTEGELRTFEECWPVGTRERLGYALLLYTAQRVGDVARMKRSDISAEGLHVIQEKTGSALVLPVMPELEIAMRAYPAKGLSLIGDRNGRPLTARSLSEMISAAVAAAGLPAKCVAHGLRKAALRRLAEHGATTRQIGAMSGHKSLREIERYTAAVDQKHLARAGADKLRTKVANSIDESG